MIASRPSTLLLTAVWVAGFTLGCGNTDQQKPHAQPPASAPAQTQPQTQPQQQAFASPQAAVDSLVRALRSNDRPALTRIFGHDDDEIISSGDPVADRAEITNFLTAYDEQHRLETNADGDVTLIVGKSDWPFPVPIVKSENEYFFDSDSGKEEILNRRIGRNELATLSVCLAIVDAEREYADLRPMGGDLEVYAPKIVSDPGKKNGLYWPTAEGEPPSPLGVLVADAAAEGYATTRPASEPPPPYHGYRYRLLTAQGPHAQGGEADYMVNGQLLGGFGVVAYPAQYGVSGIMTFITNYDGVVYQRDLGPDTQALAESMKQFDPGPEWTRADGPAPQTQTAGD